MRIVTMLGAAAVVLVTAVTAGATAYGSDTLVTVGSPSSPLAQNKQNEPAVAVNPIAPSIAAAGVNDEIDLEACNAGNPKSCPFTGGVGVSGVYFSDNGGSTWMQPTYSGWTARDCLGPAACSPHVGPIGTLPLYFENGLVADGDPAVGFGPKPDASGRFSWANGWRLYYATLASNFSSERSETSFKGFEAIAVSRLDDVDYTRAKAGDNTAWKTPVIVTRQNAALFSDHEMVAADDAATSPFFGNVYICDAAFRGQEISPNALPEPIVLNRSSDGGATWKQTQLSPAVNNIAVGGRQDCQVDTDSRGGVYVFWDGFDHSAGKSAVFMARSFDGGQHFDRPTIVTHINDTGLPDQLGQFSFDGAAGARDGSFPSISIANGAPTGAGATNQIVLTFSDGPTPSATSPGPNERALVFFSRNRGDTWTAAGSASPTTDRPDFPAITISPDGRDAYITYMNFLQPWQPSALSPPRLMQGVVRHADVNPATGAIGAWSELNRGPTGDARGSSQNDLTRGFLGDYDYAFATNDFAVLVWNDVRDAADCPAIDAYRQALLNGTATTSTTDPARPAPNTDCPATFGNTDIFGGSYADPTVP